MSDESRATDRAKQSQFGAFWGRKWRFGVKNKANLHGLATQAAI